MIHYSYRQFLFLNEQFLFLHRIGADANDLDLTRLEGVLLCGVVSIGPCISIINLTCDGITELARFLRTPIRAFKEETNHQLEYCDSVNSIVPDSG